MESSTIRAFQTILPNWQFEETDNWAEDFAIKRFLKKMEVPCDSTKEARAQQCWENWLSVDSKLPNVRLPSSEWYRARALLHEWLSTWRLGPTDFSSGSEFNPTRGRGSVEAKLSASRWTSTYDNFGNFSRLCYSHKALKRAVKRRFSSYIFKRNFNKADVNRYLYQRFSSEKDVAFRCFEAKLCLLTEFTHGSRFSTVRKNNEKDRPINIEAFGNILVQKMVGNGFRTVLKESLGIDLDRLQDTHRIRIANLNIATIDLSDASDSVSLSLCKFLLPKRIYRYLMTCRSDMVLGPDGSYYLTRKISSMGNGFTFELMTLILTAICRVLDNEATVYGDDIIIDVNKSSRLIELLQEVGFKVNTDKSFVDGPFRESCGANWHQEYGYIQSFDFEYPESIHDCVVLYNKTMHLSRGSYGAFSKLEQALRRAIPQALRGVWTHHDEVMLGQVTGASPVLGGYFRTPKVGRCSKLASTIRKSDYDPTKLSYRKITGTFFAFRWVPKLRTPCLKSFSARKWAKYEMYLSASRVQKDEIRGEGAWIRKLMLTVDNHVNFEARDLAVSR